MKLVQLLSLLLFFTSTMLLIGWYAFGTIPLSLVYVPAPTPPYDFTTITIDGIAIPIDRTRVTEYLATKQFFSTNSAIENDPAAYATQGAAFATWTSDLRTREAGYATQNAEYATQEAALATWEAENVVAITATWESTLATRDVEAATREARIATLEAEIATKIAKIATYEAEYNTWLALYGTPVAEQSMFLKLPQDATPQTMILVAPQVAPPDKSSIDSTIFNLWLVSLISLATFVATTIYRTWEEKRTRITHELEVTKTQLEIEKLRKEMGDFQQKGKKH